MLEVLGAKVARVVVSDIVDDIFYTRIVLDVNGKELEFGARPSDDFALAVRTKVPVFVEEHVLERVGVSVDDRHNEETTTELFEGPLASLPGKRATAFRQQGRVRTKQRKCIGKGSIVIEALKTRKTPAIEEGVQIYG